MKPVQAEAEQARAATVTLKERLKALKVDGAPRKKSEKLEADIREREKAARDAQAKVDGIDAAVFDLKAVNPNARIATDERTPDEVMQSIEQQGQIVAETLSTLRALLRNGSSLPGAVGDSLACKNR